MLTQAQKLRDMFPIGSVVCITKNSTWKHNASGAWRKHDAGMVTGYNGNRDVILNGDQRNSVDMDRVSALRVLGVYEMTDVRDEKVAGCLLELVPGERFALCHEGRIVYLRPNKRQDSPHYTELGPTRFGGKTWIRELLDAGVIVHESQVEKPLTVNSMRDVPHGMVVQYLLDGQTHPGIVYPYVFRSRVGVWAYKAHTERWHYIPWSNIAEDHPWMLDIQQHWDAANAVLAEAFEYPRLPASCEQYQKELADAE